MTETADQGMASQEFQDLVRAIKGGSSEAITKLIVRHTDSILRIIRRRFHQLLRSQFDTEDFAQVVWASFIANIDQISRFDNPRELERFLARVAENKVADACRRRMILQKNNVNRERRLDIGQTSSGRDVASADPTPSHTVALREQCEQLMNGLPPRYRQFLALRAAGHTFEEIAEEMDVHERTVRRIFKNLAKGPAE